MEAQVMLLRESTPAAELAARAISSVVNGEVDPITAHINISRMEAAIKLFKENTYVRDITLRELAKYGKAMTDEEAKAFIADECGFDPEKIRILHEVNTYEVNKHHRLRKSGTFDRAPVYEATDWNYVRFDCACFMYELVNGELRFYCC